MSTLLAIDIALLPPLHVRYAAIQLSGALPAAESHGLRLDEEHIPHITLSQFFVRAEEFDAAMDKVDEVLRAARPLHLTVTGGGKGSNSVTIAIDNTPELQALHERVMEATRGYERPGGTPATFYGGDARIGDVMWVTSYRLKSSFAAYTPHITLGHASRPPDIAPMSFTADTVAACHLGRFCTCREVKRVWTLI
jgi:2'-5' RNA ligase